MIASLGRDPPPGLRPRRPTVETAVGHAIIVGDAQIEFDRPGGVKRVSETGAGAGHDVEEIERGVVFFARRHP